MRRASIIFRRSKVNSINNSSRFSSSFSRQLQPSTTGAVAVKNPFDHFPGQQVRNFGINSQPGRNFATNSQSGLAMSINARKTERVVPEGVINNWDINRLTPEEILKTTTECIDKLKKSIDKVANTADDNISYATVLEPILEADQLFRNTSALTTFPQHVSVDIGLRNASREAESAAAQAVVEVQMQPEVFKKLLAYHQKVLCGEETLSKEKQRALEKLVRDGKRNGLHLEEATRSEIKGMMTRMNEIAVEYQKNIAEDKTTQYFTKEELEGVPQSFLDGLEKDAESGKFKVTLEYPHLFPITKHCRIPETRRIMEKLHASKCMAVNTLLVEEIIAVRDKHAQILGYRNHAAYVHEVMMAQNPEAVEHFLMDLATKLKPLWEKEKASMLEIKKKQCEELGLEFDSELKSWDIRYYMQRVEEAEYSVKDEDYKPYFPVEHVTVGLLEIYQGLLQVKFTLVPDAPVWHPDVSMYQVNDKSSGELMGYFFLDLYPREGKYGHACCIPIQYGYEDSTGKHKPSVIAMVCNFTKPLPNKPALLDHSEVETFFHEFGHVMHSICCRTETTMFSGASTVETDFVECPSQMLENWVWHKTPLAILSKHYQTGKPLPDEMVEKLVKSRICNQGIFNLKQVVLALFDQRIHKTGVCDTAAFYASTMKEITGLDAQPETNFAANFGHLLGGYSARYYSYLWSQVFCMDLFETGFNSELMDPERGLKYRNMILKPGGSKDASEMLKDFLGRDPKPDAFLRSKGLAISN